MNRLNFSDVAQTLIDQDAIEPPPRDYVLYGQDVSECYSTYDIGADPSTETCDMLPLNSGHAIAYYAVSPSNYGAGYEYVEKYIGTHWPALSEWHRDHVIDLMLHRATQVHRIDQLDENDVVPTFKKWLEGIK